MARQPLLSGRGQQAAGSLDLTSLPAPVRGWNTRDPVAKLNPLYAQILDNLYPNNGVVGQRGGAVVWADGMGDVRSLISFQPNNTANAKLFACDDTGIFDITAGGTVVAPVAPLTDGRLETVNITNSAGTNYIWGCNGVDKIILSSDGVTWTSIDGASSPAITGITTTDANWCWLFKRRIFVILKDSMKCAYGPIDSIAGAFAPMNLGAIFHRGGKLLSGANWTMDGGDGPDDYCVFVTSEGELALYRGINPASAASWELVGVFYCGRPASRRCFAQYGGDLVINTELGLISVARLVASKLLQPSEALSDAIRPTFAQAHQAYRGNDGWQTLVYPSYNALITNVPTSATEAVQYVMNSITGAWCSFSNWNARCFVLHNGVIYFGTADGNAAKAWDGILRSDFSSDIITTWFAAPSRFTGVRQSQVGMFRPIIATDGRVELAFGFASDFDTPQLTSRVPRDSTGPSGIWGTGLWGVMLWSGSVRMLRNWFHASCDPGTYVALYLQTRCQDATLMELSGVDYQVKPAGWM